MGKRARIVGLWLIWCSLGVIAVLAGLVLLTQTPYVQNTVGRRLGEYISGEIGGALTIGRIDELNLDRVVARHVSLLDAKGRRVIVADRVVLYLDIARLREGTLRFRRATLNNATVRLETAASGLPTLLESLGAENPSLESTSEPLHAIVDHIELSEVTLYGELLGLKGLRVEHVSARGRIEYQRQLEIKIEQAQGRVVRPFPFEGRLDKLKGTISGDTRRGIRLTVNARRDPDQASVALVYALSEGAKPSDAQTLDLTVQAALLSPDTLRGLGFSWIGPLRIPVTGQVRLLGAPSDLAVTAQLTTEAGDATLQGRLSSTAGVSVALYTRAMDLAKALSGGPRVTVAGSAKLVAPQSGAAPQVELQIEPLVYDTIALPAFRVRGAIEPTLFRIEELTARDGGRSISGSGQVGYDGSLKVAARVAIADIGREPNIQRQAPGASGALEADISLAMPNRDGRRIDFQGRIILRDLRYGLLVAQRLELSGSAHGDPTLPRLDLRVRGSELSISGYSLGDTEFSLKGDQRAYRALGNMHVQGQQTFHLDAVIQADRRTITANAEQIELFLKDRSWRGAARNLKWTRGKSISLELLRLANRSQRLEISGEVLFHGGDQLNAQLQDFDLEVLHALLGDKFPIRTGRADVQLELRGDVSQPQLSLQGALRDSAIKGLTSLGGVYFITYQDGRVQVDAEADLGQRGSISVTGTGELAGVLSDPLKALLNVNYQLKVTTKALDLSAVGALLEQELAVKGSVSGELQMAGTPEQPSIRGALHFQPLQLTGWSPLTVDVDVNYLASQWTAQLKLADSLGELASVHAEANLAWATLVERPEAAFESLSRGPWTVSGRLLGRNLQKLPRPLSDLAPWPIVLAADFSAHKEQGNASVDMNYRADWDGDIPGTVCARKSRPYVTGKALLYDGFTYFSASGYVGKSHVLETDGALETPLDQWIAEARPARPGKLSATARITVAAMQSFPWLCEYGSGNLGASIDVNDFLTEHPSGSVQLDARFSPKPVIRRVKRRQQRRAPPPTGACSVDPFAISLNAKAQASGLTLSGLLTGCGGGPTRLSASLPLLWGTDGLSPAWATDREINARAESNGGQLRPLLERIPGVASGDLTTHGVLVVSGKPDQVRFSGGLKLSHGSIQLAATGQKATDISVELVGHGNWLELKALSARDGPGVLRASGSIGLAGWIPKRAKLALLVDRFPIRREAADLGWVTGNAEVTTEITDKDAVTLLTVKSLTVVIPEKSGSALQQLDPHPDVEIATAKLAVDDNPYVITVRLDGSRGLWVKRSDFTARIKAFLDLVYTDPELTVSGDVHFERGEFVALDKNFKLNAGSLAFDGTSEINPQVYLSATHIPKSAGASRVDVAVTGTMLEPRVAFYSQDCEGEDGALTLLLTGRCSVSDNETSSQDLQGSRDAFAWGLTGGVLTLGARRGLGDVVQLLSVERVADVSQGSRTRVSAGFNADGLIPKFMRNVVQHAYVQGAVATPQNSSSQSGGEQSSGGQSTNNQTNQSATQTGLDTDFLLELSFPYNLIWSGKLQQPLSWGSDITWEP